jgi:hypothetical protein
MRKIITALVLCILFGPCGCNKKTSAQAGGDYDINVWLSPGKDDVRYSIANIPLSYTMLDVILGKATEDWRRHKLEDHDIPAMGLVYNLDPRLVLSNALPALALADKHGITNVVLRLNRIQLPMRLEKDVCPLSPHREKASG